MGDTIGFKFDVAEVKTQLQNLPDLAYTDKLLKEIAQAFLDQIKTNAPKRTGKYKNSWKITKTTPTLIRCETKEGKLYRWLEFDGTKKHTIRPKNKLYLRWYDSEGDHSPTAGISRDKPVFSKLVKHPGTEAQPHTRPAIKHIVEQIPRVLYRDMGQANTLFKQEAKKYSSAKISVRRTVTRKTGRKRLVRKRTQRTKVDR